MTYSFRDLVEKLRQQGHIEDIEKPVDIRHIAALVDKSEKALVFHNVNDYAMPVVSGIANGRERIGAAFDCAYSEVYKRLDVGLSNPIEPETPKIGILSSATCNHVGGGHARESYANV